MPQRSTLTSQASTKTIARRNKVLGKVHCVVSGNDSYEQLQWLGKKVTCMKGGASADTEGCWYI